MNLTHQDIAAGRRRALGLLAAAAAVALAGCGTVGSNEPAPEGFYRVQNGDTLYAIARKQRRSVRELVRWNNLSDANQIEVGQLIRVKPESGGATSASGSASGSASPAVKDTPRVDSGQSAKPPASTIGLQWPADGRVTARFSPPATKGITIAVPAGSKVRAAAPGRAIHVGNLRGYGMLVIIKHNDDWLTVYGNLDKPLVSEGSQISAGQDVGTIGSDGDLHFEVRGNGKPVDPANYLPARG